MFGRGLAAPLKTSVFPPQERPNPETLHRLLRVNTPETANMVEKFVGTWKMISSENFDDYMKAIGTRERHIEKEREKEG